MAWRTTEEANQDLSDIALEGALAFGLPQSRRYVRRILEVFDTLAAHPHMAPERRGARQTVRLMPHEAHNILYITQGDHIVILRVLHHLQDWFDLL